MPLGGALQHVSEVVGRECPAVFGAENAACWDIFGRLSMPPMVGGADCDSGGGEPLGQSGIASGMLGHSVGDVHHGADWGAIVGAPVKHVAGGTVGGGGCAGLGLHRTTVLGAHGPWCPLCTNGVVRPPTIPANTQAAGESRLPGLRRSGQQYGGRRGAGGHPEASSSTRDWCGTERWWGALRTRRCAAR